MEFGYKPASVMEFGYNSLTADMLHWYRETERMSFVSHIHTSHRETRQLRMTTSQPWAEEHSTTEQRINSEIPTNSQRTMYSGNRRYGPHAEIQHVKHRTALFEPATSMKNKWNVCLFKEPESQFNESHGLCSDV